MNSRERHSPTVLNVVANAVRPAQQDSANLRVVRNSLRSLPEASVAREAAYEVLSNGTIRNADIKYLAQLLATPVGPSLRERNAAAWAFGYSHPESETRNTVCRVLEDILCNRIQIRADAIRGRTTRVLSSLLIIVMLGSLNHSLMGAALILFIIVAAVSIPANAWNHDRQINRLRAICAESLGRLRATQALSALAGTVFHTDALERTPGYSALSHCALQALPPIVDALTEDDYGRLPVGAVSGMCRMLLLHDESLVLCALAGLRKAGDGQAVEPVERQVEHGRSAAVRAKAAEVLPLLLERRRAERDPQTLLRAAQAPRLSSSLLHPVETPGQVARQSLLRPAGPDQDETA